MSPPSAIRLSRRARGDILDIWLYVAESNPTTADRILDDIERIFGLIAEHPQIGRQRPEVMPGLRSFAIAPWVIFYRIEDEAVGIVRIIHGARDLDEVDY